MQHIISTSFFTLFGFDYDALKDSCLKGGKNWGMRKKHQEIKWRIILLLTSAQYAETGGRTLLALNMALRVGGLS